MGISDLFGKKETVNPDDFKAVEAVSDAAFVCSPVTGAVIERKDVESSVFADGLLGKGCGIKPLDGVLYAPVTGTVTVTYPGSQHAIGFVGEGAVQVLVHVGLGTSTLEGRGFHYLVEQGSRVKAGQPVLAFDREVIRNAGLDDIVLVALPNAGDFAGVEQLANGHVDAGEKLFEIDQR